MSMGPPPAAVRRVPIRETSTAAYRTVFGQLDQLVRAALLPFLLNTVLTVPTLMAALYRRANRVIAVSDGVKADVADITGLPPEKITTIHNPYFLDEIAARAKEASGHPWLDGPDGPPVLEGIDLGIPAGQFVALVGANGAGKTTLTKQIIGLLRPTAGQVWVGGEDAGELSIAELARQVGYLFQHPERQIFASTVRDEVAFGPRNLGLDATAVDERVAAALERAVSFSLFLLIGRAVPLSTFPAKECPP